MRPCGHSAKDKGILISVYASCLSHQVPRQLDFSIKGGRNDKNTGLFTLLVSDCKPVTISDSQHSTGQNSTRVRCGADDIASECQCLPQADWKTWNMWNRIVTLRDAEMWALALVPDDEAFITLMDTGWTDYSGLQVLKVGDGEEPTKEELQAATEEYAVYRNKTN